MDPATLEFEPAACYCRVPSNGHRHHELSTHDGLYLSIEHYDGSDDDCAGEEGGIIRLTVHWSLFQALPGPSWVATGGIEFLRDYAGTFEHGKQEARLRYWHVRQLLVERGGLELWLKEPLQ